MYFQLAPLHLGGGGSGGGGGGAVSCAIDVVVTGSLVKPCHALIGQRVLINGVARARLADRPIPGKLLEYMVEVGSGQHCPPHHIMLCQS